MFKIIFLYTNIFKKNGYLASPGGTPGVLASPPGTPGPSCKFSAEKNLPTGPGAIPPDARTPGVIWGDARGLASPAATPGYFFLYNFF